MPIPKIFAPNWKLPAVKICSSFFKQWIYTAGAPHLNITWHYNAAKKIVDLTITQKQATVFDFPLEVSIAGKLNKVPVKSKTTNLSIPVKTRPASIIVDPNVNLLAAFEVIEAIQ